LKKKKKNLDGYLKMLEKEKEARIGGT